MRIVYWYYIVILFLSILYFSGCVVGRVDMITYDELVNRFEVPGASAIKNGGTNKIFSYVTFDKVWESTIILLTQEGFIVHSSKEAGVIVTFAANPLPLCSAILIEESEVITLHLNWMENICGMVYKDEKEEIRYHDLKSNKFQKASVEFITKVKDEKTATFFDKLAVQVYAGEKWKYLYKESPR